MIPQLPAHQQVDEPAPVLQCSGRFGVHCDVLKAGHGHLDGLFIRRVNLSTPNKGVVLLPTAVVGHLDGLLLATHLLHAGTHIVVQVLVVARAKSSQDVLLSQRLDCLVLADHGFLWERYGLYFVVTHSQHMHKMFTVMAQDIHREHVVGQQHDLTLGHLPVSV